MNPSEFKKIWSFNDDSVSPISSDKLNHLNLKKQSIEFLTISGLPISASPFLSFAKDGDNKYEQIDFLTNLYELEDSFIKYIVIGSDGSGNPIVIDTGSNDEIKWLDHENNFSEIFMNSSISKLAQFLIFYRKFVDTVIKENGEDAYLDCDFSDGQFQTLKGNLIRVDSKALTEKGFWAEELKMLLIDREFYKKENDT